MVYGAHGNFYLVQTAFRETEVASLPEQFCCTTAQALIHTSPSEAHKKPEPCTLNTRHTISSSSVAADHEVREVMGANNTP